MNILLLNFTLKWRSTFFRAFQFGRCLVNKGHRVTLLTVSIHNRLRKNEWTAKGVKVIETPALLPGFGRVGWDPLDIAWRLFTLARTRDRFDLVHGFDCRPCVLFPSLFLKRFRRVPYVSDWADWWGRGGIIKDRKNKALTFLTGGLETYFEESFRHRASALTVTSHALRERAIGLDLSPEWVFYIPSGCDIHSIRPEPKEEARRAAGLDIKDKIIEFMGFVHYDLELVLRAYAKIREQRNDVKLLLVGPKSPITARLRRELDISDGIIETGGQPFEKMSMYLAAADVLLMPYSNKLCNVGRGPIKLGDYLASGRPTVTNPVGDIKTMFEADRIGLLSEDTPEDFAEKVGALIDEPDLAEELGANARRVAEEKYSWEILSEQLEGYYEKVIRFRSP